MNKLKRESSGFANLPAKQSKSSKKKQSEADHTIKEREAVALIDQGKLNEAEAIYKELIALGTESYSVYANLAAIYGMQRKFNELTKLLHRALKLKPNQPELHNNLGVAYQEQGDLISAIASYRTALQIRPSYPEAHNNLGNSLKEQGDIVAAISSYKTAINLKPSYPEAHNNLGNSLKEQGDIVAAISSYKTAINLKPSYPEAHYNLGNSLKEIGDTIAAISSYKAAIKYKPNYQKAYNNLGTALRDEGDIAAAYNAYNTALKLWPGDPEAHNNLGTILKELGDLQAAIASYTTALKLKPNDPEICCNLGNALKKTGDLEAAMAIYKKAVEIDPENSNAFCGIGRVQQSMGNLKEATLSFKRAISKNPNNTGVLLELSRRIKSDQDTVELLHNLGEVKRIGLNKKDLTSLEFALANCYHKTHNYASAAKHIREANELKLSYMPSNISARIDENEQLFKSGETIKLNDANVGFGKIFIVGVPRCGSTLLESVLATNANIRDLGETKALTRAFTRLISKNNIADKERLDLAVAYEAEVNVRMDEFTHSVDKNLYNFRLSGAIARSMPAAKVIHCRRHPLDNILSMMRSNLEAGNNYTADPVHAAKFLIHHEEMLAEIKNRHKGHIFTFNYDEFVNEPEKIIKPLIKWLGLEWTDNYLHPERSKRDINTASVIEARQPISNKSVGGWKNYADLLRPAEDILRGSSLFNI